MKRPFLALAAFTFALSLLSTPVRAAELSREEQSYIVVFLTSLSVADVCGYSLVAGSLARVGDRTGVDNKIRDAAEEGFKAAILMDYDRAMLIPEVTRFVNKVLDAMQEDVKTRLNTAASWCPACSIKAPSTRRKRPHETDPRRARRRRSVASSECLILSMTGLGARQRSPE